MNDFVAWLFFIGATFFWIGAAINVWVIVWN